MNGLKKEEKKRLTSLTLEAWMWSRHMQHPCFAQQRITAAAGEISF